MDRRVLCSKPICFFTNYHDKERAERIADRLGFDLFTTKEGPFHLTINFEERTINKSTLYTSDIYSRIFWASSEDDIYSKYVAWSLLRNNTKS